MFVDFTEDSHNGAGGAPNAIPDWVDELGKLTAATGVAKSAYSVDCGTSFVPEMFC